MGSNQFQREYIEYLQSRNTELLDKLNEMKEKYENKVFSKNINKNYFVSTLEDVLNICTTLPQEIDQFFEQMVATMGLLKNILMKKSELVKLGDKISQSIHCDDNRPLLGTINSTMVRDTDPKTGKKREMKVPPMVQGHVITTGTRICLNRVSDYFSPVKRNESHPLSPIIEVSPDTNSDAGNPKRPNFRELTVPLQRLSLNKLSYKLGEKGSIIGGSSGPNIWKNSFTSKEAKPHMPMTTVEEKENIKGESETQRKTEGNSELQNRDEIENDPLEGPSWLHNEKSEPNNPNNSVCFVDFRRRKHRFAKVFDKNENSVIANAVEEREECLTRVEAEKLNECDNLEIINVNESEKRINRRINETSEDLFEDSYDGSCNTYLMENKSRSKESKGIDDSIDKIEFDQFEADIKNSMSTPYLKTNSKVSSKLVKSSSSSLSNNKSNNSRLELRDDSYPKRHLRSFDKAKTNENYSGDTTPKYVKEGTSHSLLETIKSLEQNSSPAPSPPPLGKKKEKKVSKSKGPEKNLKVQKQSILNSNEPYVMLENCLPVDKNKSKLLQSKSINEKNETSISSGKRESNLESQISINGERKRRKAAPTNLVEPNLVTKLRRE